MSAHNDTALPPLDEAYQCEQAYATTLESGAQYSIASLKAEVKCRERQLLASLQALAAAVKERDQSMELAAHSERWRRAYQEGKHLLYAMGGEVADAAFKHLPCNEGPLDQMSRRILVEPFAAPIRKRAEFAEAKLAEMEKGRSFYDGIDDALSGIECSPSTTASQEQRESYEKGYKRVQDRLNYRVSRRVRGMI